MKKQIVNFLTSPLLVIFILVIALFCQILSVKTSEIIERNFQEQKIEKPQKTQVIEILRGAKWIPMTAKVVGGYFC